MSDADRRSAPLPVGLVGNTGKVNWGAKTVGAGMLVDVPSFVLVAAMTPSVVDTPGASWTGFPLGESFW